jgi:nitroreductase
MEFDSVVNKRKSVRHFTKKKPPWKTIVYAIDAANQGPFSGNHNPLRYIIVEEKPAIKTLAKMAEQPWIADSPVIIIVCSDDKHLEDIYGERGRVYSRQQAGAAIQTLLLKLSDSKLSACWVGAYSDEIIKQTLKIPQHIQIEAIIPVGYENPREKIPKEQKIELENTLFWEKWNQTNRTKFKEPKDSMALSS